MWAGIPRYIEEWRLSELRQALGDKEFHKELVKAFGKGVRDGAITALGLIFLLFCAWTAGVL